MKPLDFFTPNKSITKSSRLTILTFWILIVIGFWVFNGNKFIPTPTDIFTATEKLVVQQDFITHLIISTTLCIKAILYATIVSLFVGLLWAMPFFNPIVTVLGKARFLSTIGLTFVFAQITPDTNTLKVTLLVFCITVFMLTSFLGIIFEVKKDELDYARSLKMNSWETLWQVVILGKADQFLEAVKQNFAIAWIMLPLVENLCRAEGGIGVLLFQENKQFHLDSVYSILFIVLLVGILLDWLLGFIRSVFCPYSVITLNK